MSDLLDSLADSLRARAEVPVAIAAVCAVLVVAGALGWLWAVAAIMAGIGWAALWPVAEGKATAPGDEAEARGTLQLQGQLPRLPLAVLEALPDAAVVIDGRGLIIAANSAAGAISPVVIGRPSSHWVRAPELIAAINSILGLANAPGNPADQVSGNDPADGTVSGHASRKVQQQRCQVRLYAPVERALDAYVTVLASGVAGTAAPAVLVVLRDFTEQESLSRMRVDFVANASHELRTPLAAIRGFVETLRGAAKDDPVAQARFLGIMQAQAERMSRLIEDLLSLSRIEMHEHVAPTGRIDIAAVSREAARALKSTADEAGVTIAERLPEAPHWVTGDKEELSQVAHNLIQNAIKYGRRGGRVDVEVCTEGRRVLLGVSDDGIGIAAEHLPRLTERFYRASTKESRERGGTGLGLAIVKHIVNRHRGELTIDSTPGKGSTFTVALPQA